MREPYLLLYQSAELASDSNTYIDYIREASALGAKRIHHYHAMLNAFKGIKPHIALPNFVISEYRQSEKPLKSTDITVRKSQFVSILNPPSTERTGNSEPSSGLSEMIQDAKLRPSMPVRAMEDDLPQGNGENFVAWSDGDVDATDYKNMMDYDPWQEEDRYESTPEPEAIVEPLEDLSLEDKSRIRRYVMLHCEQNSERTSPAGETSAPSPKHLLLLFIPGPLNALPSFRRSSQPTTPSKHMNFLAHLLRYPYLTSHDNYIRHTGYVLDSADDTPAHYLIVQEFSELRRLDWELKRKEAKHWWQKEERGALQVRVGFFKLADIEEIGKMFDGNV